MMSRATSLLAAIAELAGIALLWGCKLERWQTRTETDRCTTGSASQLLQWLIMHTAVACGTSKTTTLHSLLHPRHSPPQG